MKRCTTSEESTEKQQQKQQHRQKTPFSISEPGKEKQNQQSADHAPFEKRARKRAKTEMVQLVKVICATRRLTFAPTKQKKQVAKLLEAIFKRHSGEKSHRSNQLLTKAI